jgi:two-component system LytT family sensor kinase
MNRIADRGFQWGRIVLWPMAGAAALGLLDFTQTVAAHRVDATPLDVKVFAWRVTATWLSWVVIAPALAVAVWSDWLRQRPRIAAVAFWIALTAAAILAHTVLEIWIAILADAVHTTLSFSRWLVVRVNATIASNLAALGTLVLGMFFVRNHEEAAARLRREEMLRTELAEAQLAMLRAQLQPHFLFNTFQAISGLMTTNVPTARRMLVLLGDLLRSALTHWDQDEVTVAEEIRLLERYLAIQSIRFEDRLTVLVQVMQDTEAALVPLLLLQPLVENALRYGIEGRAGPGIVRVEVKRDGAVLRIEVSDSGSGPPREKRPQGTGIGLANTTARLTMLYGSDHQMTLTPTEDGMVATVALPFHEVAV